MSQNPLTQQDRQIISKIVNGSDYSKHCQLSDIKTIAIIDGTVYVYMTHGTARYHRDPFAAQVAAIKATLVESEPVVVPTFTPAPVATTTNSDDEPGMLIPAGLNPAQSYYSHKRVQIWKLDPLYWGVWGSFIIVDMKLNRIVACVQTRGQNCWDIAQTRYNEYVSSLGSSEISNPRTKETLDFKYRALCKTLNFSIHRRSNGKSFANWTKKEYVLEINKLEAVLTSRQ